MFREIRRIKNKISTDEARAVLNGNKRGALSVLGDNGYPYSMPINFFYDEAENRLYFHCAKSGHKIDAIKKNNKVCFTTWDDGYLEDGDWAYYVTSCVIFGKAILIEDIDVTEEKLRKLGLKYYPTAQEVEEEIVRDINKVQLIAIDIEHISGKRVHEK